MSCQNVSRFVIIQSANHWNALIASNYSPRYKSASSQITRTASQKELRESYQQASRSHAMAIRVRISGTRPPRTTGSSSPAGRGWVSPMPGELVEVRLLDGAWVTGTVSLYGNYPTGTSLRISINGGEPTYFARCNVRVVQVPPTMELPEVTSNGWARRRRHRRRRARRDRWETSLDLECFSAPRCDAESAESSNECYL